MEFLRPISSIPRELKVEFTLDYVNPASVELLGLDMSRTLNDNDEDSIIECQNCGMMVVFPDQGLPMRVQCPICLTVVFQRLPRQIRKIAKEKVLDDISISGNPVNLTEEENRIARKILTW